ncbi:hypothetical protein LSTR_LSTR005979 [Laodelphax striatellus]|uniref:Potassium channel domain-containing protein n=1 Tax=Laodelphax striatellus TaxID=195883 RepID=A0A482XNI5_LAOST|nr:hypothetical protein LSTR_LSTR005979 [Laodelphax striatellus]
MSKKQWFLLWLIFISYLFLGATVFYYLERKLELERRHIVRGEQEEIEDLLRMNYAADAPQEQEQILQRLTEYCGKPFSTGKSPVRESSDGNATVADRNNATDAMCDDDSGDTCEDEKPIRWTFYNSFFFALTTLSTIGYGNLSPTSMEGRLLVICYSLIGIPLNGIVLSQLGECFGSTFMRVHHRYKTHRFETKLSLIMDIIMYLIPGVVFFIFIPSGFFVYFEGWTFDESIYYAFVTLTTIGYGDFVAGQTGSDNPWYNIYKVLLIIWFMFGLGYLVMILGFIARAMQSKKIARLEQAVTQTLKQTQNKIWKEFTHEVTVVRRALNEMYLLKVKPVYRDGAETGPLLGSKRLSRSAPQLSEWPVLRRRDDPESGEDLEAEEDLEAAFRSKRLQRRQAFSENVLKARPQRTASDGDLTLIDRTATFRSATPVEPGLLLARIVDAIGTPLPARGHDSASESGSDDFRLPKYNVYGDGINMFSDSDILASEWGDDLRDRSRTHSEGLSPPPYHSDYDEQRTWSGNEYSHYKNNLCQDPMPSKDSGWSQSDQLLAPARGGLRRMSMAAINFFTPAAKWMKRGSLQKSTPDDILQQQQPQQQQKPRERKSSSHGGKARTRRSGINRHASDGYLKKHRYSLQDNGNVARGDEDVTVDDSVNYLSYTAGRRPSLLAALAREMGPKRESQTSISPVLEQTSVADFIRVLSTLHDQQDRDPSVTICNGDTARRASSRRLFRSTSTLDTYQRAEGGNPSLVTSDAAFTPSPKAPDVRRRRFSFVPTLSSFSTNEKPEVKKLSTEGLFQRHRSRSQSLSPVDSSVSLATMPSPVDRRIRRLSSSGAKDKSFLGRRRFRVMTSPRSGPPPPLLKTLTPPRLVITSPAGHEQATEQSRFTVSQADSSVAIQKQEDPNSQSTSVAWQASQDASTDKKDSLTDVVVVKL